MDDRARGIVLYACALVLLAGGGLWWLRAAPHDDPDPRLAQWRRSAQELLPEAGDQEAGDTVALSAGRDHLVLSDVESGEFQVSVVCVGPAESQVRVSLGEAGSDSGHGLSCAGGEPADSFTVSTSGQLRLHVSVNEAGPVIFRYALVRTAPG
ncbi:DUF6023 family protein [Actinoplanes sp. CA-030573]|uniref:DUF6023 family protein n=1 Tax=Actinoplanes sp. CA-030573 TaxID=3239898 RepID=UPI003D8B28D2